MGVLGFFDPATRVRIPIQREDFGQTFGYYGGEPSFYLVLPYMVPSSGRDAIGRLLDYPFNLPSVQDRIMKSLADLRNL